MQEIEYTPVQQALDRFKSQDVDSDTSLIKVLAGFPEIVLALVFGSIAKGKARFESDLDIALTGKKPLTAEQKMAIIEALASQSGRTIDLIDLNTAGEPLLSQILRHGRRLMGNDSAYAQWISRHLIEEADFMPLHRRILEERRIAWIGK
jgi:uncharacterized protein